MIKYGTKIPTRGLFPLCRFLSTLCAFFFHGSFVEAMEAERDCVEIKESISIINPLLHVPFLSIQQESSMQMYFKMHHGNRFEIRDIEVCQSLLEVRVWLIEQNEMSEEKTEILKVLFRALKNELVFLKKQKYGQEKINKAILLFLASLLTKDRVSDDEAEIVKALKNRNAIMYPKNYFSLDLLLLLATVLDDPELTFDATDEKISVSIAQNALDFFNSGRLTKKDFLKLRKIIEEVCNKYYLVIDCKVFKQPFKQLKSRILTCGNVVELVDSHEKLGLSTPLMCIKLFLAVITEFEVTEDQKLFWVAVLFDQYSIDGCFYDQATLDLGLFFARARNNGQLLHTLLQKRSIPMPLKNDLRESFKLSLSLAEELVRTRKYDLIRVFITHVTILENSQVEHLKNLFDCYKSSIDVDFFDEFIATLDNR